MKNELNQSNRIFKAAAAADGTRVPECSILKRKEKRTD